MSYRDTRNGDVRGHDRKQEYGSLDELSDAVLDVLMEVAAAVGQDKGEGLSLLAVNGRVELVVIVGIIGREVELIPQLEVSHLRHL